MEAILRWNGSYTEVEWNGDYTEVEWNGDLWNDRELREQGINHSYPGVN